MFREPVQCFVHTKLPKEKSLNRKAVEEVNFFNSCRKIKDMTQEDVDAILMPLNLAVRYQPNFLWNIYEIYWRHRTVADVIVFFYLCFFSFSTRRRWSCTTLVLTTLLEVSYYLGSLSITRIPTPLSLPRSRSYLANQMAKERSRLRQPWEDLSKASLKYFQLDLL